MKALVVTNCATAAYTAGLQAIFPQWEVKGVQIDLARKWLSREPNPVFEEYLGHTTFLITSEPQDGMFARVPNEATQLVIPVLYFRGLHPDSFHFGWKEGEGLRSALGTGNLHSRIAATAFVLGWTKGDAIAAFSERVYERIGYLSVFETEKAELLGRFAAHGIPLAGNFEDWMRHGNFLYTYNHPMAFVFNDILRAALEPCPFDLRVKAQARQALTNIPDFLEPSVRWPIYPEIADHHGIPSEFVWRTGETTGAKRLSLDEFVTRSYGIFESCPTLDPDCIPGFEQCRDALA